MNSDHYAICWPKQMYFKAKTKPFFQAIYERSKPNVQRNNYKIHKYLVYLLRKIHFVL